MVAEKARNIAMFEKGGQSYRKIHSLLREKLVIVVIVKSIMHKRSNIKLTQKDRLSRQLSGSTLADGGLWLFFFSFSFSSCLTSPLEPLT